MNANEFKKAGRSTVELISEYWAGIESRPVAHTVTRNDVFLEFENTIKATGEGSEFLAQHLPKLLDKTMAMSHPLYLGLVNSTPLPSAVLGDLVVSAIDNNGGASHQGLAQAAAEREVVRWLSQAIGYENYGMIFPGGSFATLHGLQLAKAKHFPEWHQTGPTSVKKLPKIYTSDAVHFSTLRAATTLGFGKNSLGIIPSTGRGSIDCDGLEQQITADLETGHQPFAVVATAGTTGTGAIDDLKRIASLCEKFGLWMHVDGCYGGAIAISNRCKHLVDGMECADSIAIDLHKWFFMPLTAGICFTKHSKLATELFAVNATYIPDDGYVEAYSRGFPTSRRSTGLAFWIAMKISGWQVVCDAIERNIELTRRLETGLAAHGFRILAGGQLSIACVRWEPAGLSAEERNQLQVEIAESVCDSGTAWFATTSYRSEIWMRFNPVNLQTCEHHIENLIQIVAKTASEVGNPATVVANK